MSWTTTRILQTIPISFIFFNIPKSVNKSHRKKECGLCTEKKKKNKPQETELLRKPKYITSSKERGT